MYNVSIPEISNEELLARYKQVKPIVEVAGKKYFLRDFTLDELRKLSYTWNADQDKTELVNIDLYRPYREFECIHRFGYYGFFTPTIAGVLAQIPKHTIQLVDAFEIIEFPKAINDLSKNKIVFDNGFHISKVRLYTSINNPYVNFEN